MVANRVTSSPPRRGVLWGVVMWLAGIVGGIAAFSGLFIAFGPEDQSLGLGGELSWEVGEISNAWMVGLLIGGFVLLAVAVAMAIMGRKKLPAASSPLTDLLLHTFVFVAVNAFVWIQDLALGNGLDYALYMTIPWGIGLLIHAGTYLFSERRSAPPVTRIVEEKKERELLPH